MTIDTDPATNLSIAQQQLSIVQQFQELAAIFRSMGMVDPFKTDPGHIKGPVVINGVAAVRLLWTLPNAKTGSNVLHFTFSTGAVFSAVLANQLFSTISGFLNTSGLVGQLHTGTSLINVGLRDLSAANNPEFLSNVAAVPGTGTGSALPPQTSLVVTLRTAKAGQAFRGRVYLPGFATIADAGNGTATTAASTAAGAFIGDLLTFSSGGDTWNLVIALPARNGYTGSTGTVHPPRVAGFQQVTAAVVENLVWDTQRRRSERISR